MKKIIRVLLGFVALVFVAVAGFAIFVSARGIPHYDVPKLDAKVAVTPERVAHGQAIVMASCADCHTNPQTRKFSGQLIPDLPAEFGKIHSANITNDKKHGLGNWTDGQIITVLRTGIGPDGRFRVVMPSFVHMSDEDINSVVAFLRSDNALVQADASPSAAQEPSFLTKALTNTVMKPTPLPSQVVEAPAPTDAQAFGRYLVVGRYKCYDCHSKDFKTNNPMEPEKSEGYLAGGNTLLNRQQQEVKSRNLTMDGETGIGDWSEGQFVQAVRFGMSPHGALSYPMPKYSLMSEEEAKAIFAYLRTVPIIKNATPEDGATAKL
ncbi:cytochrome c [Hymenobacter sp. BT175]|uniref:c-type cytochrome n=1 Tax=Hymenobacter translucens TaxID=2886507 RepID=UPI001D0F0E94|nr:cytochrome c [Hymenobacter translucens]MCC2545108.1 cytochrome c [Hymenobacter translucens]